MAKPPPSDWGKLSQGQSYIPWALDIARAVSALGLGENVGMLFWYAIEQSWGHAHYRRRDKPGWPDPRPVSIVYAEVARHLGSTKQRIYEAKKWLVAARLLLEQPEGLYVNKNADQWINPRSGEPLLNAHQLAYAAGARRRTEGAGGDDEQSPEPTHDGNGVPLPCAIRNGNGTPLPYSCPSNGTPLPARDGGNGTPLPFSARIEDRAQKAKSPSGLKEFAASSSNSREDRFAKMPPIPRDEMCPPEHGPHDLTPAETEEVYRLIWLAYGKGAICAQFHHRRRLHTAAAWKAGIAKLERECKVPFSIGLLDRAAGDFDDAGRSKYDPKVARKAAKQAAHDRRVAGFAKLFPSTPKSEGTDG